jgi:single-strand DNA-binding protein
MKIGYTLHIFFLDHAIDIHEYFFIKGQDMAGYNRIVMIGNLTRDPEYRQLASGQAVCRLGLASNRQFKNRQTGTMIQEVCFVDVDVWGAQAESCRQYLSKGRPVLIEGRLKFDTWEEPNGQARSKHSIVADRVVFLGSATDSADTVEDTAQTGTGAGTASFAAASQKQQAAPQSQLDPAIEKELSDQIEQIKQRAVAKPAVKAGVPGKKGLRKNEEDGNSDTSAAGAFQDEPPFQDDLPF